MHSSQINAIPQLFSWSRQIIHLHWHPSIGPIRAISPKSPTADGVIHVLYNAMGIIFVCYTGSQVAVGFLAGVADGTGSLGSPGDSWANQDSPWL